MLIIRVHVLIPGNILYHHVLYYTIISYDIYLYISILVRLLVLYQNVLSPIGVQNIDFFFNTLRYSACPNYLPFYHFLFRYTRINICFLGSEIKNERDSVQYIPEGTVRYRTETCLPT